MIHVSNDFLELMKTERTFTYSARVTLKNGTVFNLTEDDLELTDCSIVSSMDSAEFIVGNAICQQLNLSFFNPREKYKGYDFYGAVIIPKLIFWLTEEESEAIQFNPFTVCEPETYGTTISLKAYDDFYKADCEFEKGTLTFPTTAITFLQYCCQRCGLALMTQSFANSNYQIKTAPTNTTFRQCIGYVAMLAGGNALIRDGGVSIEPYNSSLLDRPQLDGGYFGDAGTSYTSGDDADGGGFDPWEAGEDLADVPFMGYEAHSFTESYNGATIGTDDVVITGISTKGEVVTSTEVIDIDGQKETIAEKEERTFTSGEEGYVLSVENALFTNNWQDGVDRIGAVMIGLRFRPFSVTIPSYPLAEIGDCAYVCDQYGTQYLSFVTEVDFNFHRSTTLKCTASDPVRNMSRYFSSKAMVQAIKAARQVSNEMMPLYDIEAQRLTSVVANALGFYTTREVQDDGSTISYLHNKVSLESSDIIWKRTSEGFVVSTDYGQTWNAGLDADGNAVLNMLSVKGIRWDWARGGTITLGGENNVSGTMYIQNEYGDTVGTFDKSGANINGKITTTDGDGDTENKTVVGNGNIKFYRGGNLVSRVIQITGGGRKGTGYNCSPSGDYAALSYSTGSGNVVTKLTYGLNMDDERTETLLLWGNTGVLSGNILFNRTSGYIHGLGWYVEDDIKNIYHSAQSNRFTITDTTRIQGDFSVSGTKSRSVDTQYGTIDLNAFETPSCHFADIGSGMVGDDGKCCVFFDEVFAETIDRKSEYQVLITRTSSEAVEWVEKKDGYFIAHGEPGATFDWMIIGYQRDYTAHRLNREYVGDDEIEEDNPIVNDSYTAYGTVNQMVEEYDHETAVNLLDEALEQYEQEVNLI